MTRTNLGGFLGTAGVLAVLIGGCGGAVDLKTGDSTAGTSASGGGTKMVDDTPEERGGSGGSGGTKMVDDTPEERGGSGGSGGRAGNPGRGGSGGSGGSAGSAGSGGSAGSSGAAGSGGSDSPGWLWDLDCPNTVEDYCALEGAVCITDWDSARHVENWCANPDVNAVVYSPSCNGYDVIGIYGVDEVGEHPDLSSSYFYDQTSGELVHIDSNRIPSHTMCVAGESGTQLDQFGCEYAFVECANAR